jgi:SHS family lactate transporter-like MFS transporter
MADQYATEPKIGATASGDEAVHESHHPHELTIKEYALTRFSTLKPPMHKAPNPVRLLTLLSGKQWLFFLVGFLAWVSRYILTSCE